MQITVQTGPPNLEQVCSSEESVNYQKPRYGPQSIASTFPQSSPRGESTNTPEGRQELLLYLHLLLQSPGQNPLPGTAPLEKEVVETQNGLGGKGP